MSPAKLVRKRVNARDKLLAVREFEYSEVVKRKRHDVCNEPKAPWAIAIAQAGRSTTRVDSVGN